MNNLNDINKKQHHTDLYVNENLIVRRAQEFQIRITFDRAYNPLQDQFLLEFVIGEVASDSLFHSWCQACCNIGKDDLVDRVEL